MIALRFNAIELLAVERTIRVFGIVVFDPPDGTHAFSMRNTISCDAIAIEKYFVTRYTKENDVNELQECQRFLLSLIKKLKHDGTSDNRFKIAGNRYLPRSRVINSNDPKIM